MNKEQEDVWDERDLLDDEDIPPWILNISKTTFYKWIPVSERLPEPGVDALVFQDGRIFVEGINPATGTWSLNIELFECNPTHWMPLPAAPEEDK